VDAAANSEARWKSGCCDWRKVSITTLVGNEATESDPRISAGIGFTTVEQLALHGAKVYIAARSEHRAQEAIKSLLKKHPSIAKGLLIWLPLDLASPSGAIKAANDLSSREKRLDIIGKAGTE
jgi:hypothetical protein